MPAFIIPTDPDVHWTQTTSLDGVEYILRFAYNQSEDTYTLSIQNPITGVDVKSGLKLTTNWAMLQRWSGIGGLPPGELVVSSANPQDDAPPRLGELAPGGRCTLWYFDAVFLATGV